MGFLLASMFGARYRVYEFDENESKTPYYIVSTISNMWLADRNLDELHHFIAPRADVVRLEDGPRSLTGIDKGRWFVVITDEAPEQDGWMGYKKLYCNSEGRALGIHDDADRIRHQYESKHRESVPARSVWEQIEVSERHLQEIRARREARERAHGESVWEQIKRSEQAGREAEEAIARFDQMLAEESARQRAQAGMGKND